MVVRGDGDTAADDGNCDIPHTEGVARVDREILAADVRNRVALWPHCCCGVAELDRQERRRGIRAKGPVSRPAMLQQEDTRTRRASSK